MTKASAQKGRTEVARIINGSREAIYGAFLDPVALASWLPPGTMTSEMHSFDPHVGGGYHLSLTYQSDDPALAGEMGMTVSLSESRGGTEVSILCEDIPPGIRPEDNEAGCRSSLGKLAAFIERPGRK